MFKRFVGATLSVAVVLTPLSVLAVANPTPDQHWAAPNSGFTGESVRAVVAASDGSYYVAGDFIDYSTSYGSAVLASASTGVVEKSFPDVDDSVKVTISDGAGGWYIGGDFDRVGPLQRSKLAHITASGSADPIFNANVDFNCGMCNPSINTLVLDEGNGTLYVGGNLENVQFGAATVHGVVALDASTGVVSLGFNLPNISGADQSVYTLALDEGAVPNPLLYVGGSFTTIGAGTNRNNLVSFDGVTGATTSFDPDVSSDVLTLAVNTINHYVYAGGIFTTVNQNTTPVTRNHVALFDPAGVVDGLFDADASSTVNALALDTANGVLYLGGGFNDLGGTARNRLGAVGMGDGAVNAFEPNPNDYVIHIALNADGSTLYAIGGFSLVNGGVVDRAGIASFDTGDSSARPFAQAVHRPPASIALSEDEESVLIGVEDQNYRADDNIFEPFFTSPRPILHILSDGTVDPNFNSIPSQTGFVVGGDVFALALSPDEQTLYVGGSFGCVGVSIGCTPRYDLAALNTADGTVLPFDPDMDGTVRALAVSSDGNTLYAGGDFTFVNNGVGALQRKGVAAFNTATSAATAFDPDMDDEVLALALTSDDSTLYAGGTFGASGPQDRNFAAAFLTAGAGTLTNFDPHPNAPIYALALSQDEATVYAGGDFSTVNDGTVSRSNVAAFIATTGAATDFDPNVNDTVYALAFGPDGTLYLGGSFDRINGEDHEYIAAVDATTGQADAGFDANLEGTTDAVYALAHGGTSKGLLAGGKFQQSFRDPGDTELPYVVTVNIAHYPDASTPTPTPPPPPTPTPTPHGGGSSGGGGIFLPGFSPTPSPILTPVPEDRNTFVFRETPFKEGDLFSWLNGGARIPEQNVYVFNEFGYKRLFLNPTIFGFYGQLGGFPKVKLINFILGAWAPPTSGLVRNCEANDQKVYVVVATGEDTGVLHHVDMSGDAAVAQDPYFFHKVFCINSAEFNWYPKSPVPFTSLSQLPVYTDTSETDE